MRRRGVCGFRAHLRFGPGALPISYSIVMTEPPRRDRVRGFRTGDRRLRIYKVSMYSIVSLGCGFKLFLRRREELEIFSGVKLDKP